MIGYFIRRIGQLGLAVLVFMSVLYGLLYLTLGGLWVPRSSHERSRAGCPTCAYMLSYLGMDKPPELRYLVWLLGDDWLGAEWMYVGWEPPAGGRFYADFNPDVGEPVWVKWHGGTVAEEWRLFADKIWVNPVGEPPDDVDRGYLMATTPKTITVRLFPLLSHTTTLWTPKTEWVMRDRAPRPTGTGWVPVGWLFGPEGLLGVYARFHGERRGLLRLDFGKSWAVAQGRPIRDLLLARVGNSILLMGAAVLLALLVAFPGGIYGVLRPHSRLSSVFRFLHLFFSAAPVFWLAVMAVMVFFVGMRAAGWPYLPGGSVYSVRPPVPCSLLGWLQWEPGSLGDRAVHLLMPMVVLSLFPMAAWSRLIGDELRKALGANYSLAARAKGLPEWAVVGRALCSGLPVIGSAVVLQIPGLLGGLVMTEAVFSWQGVGRVFFDALNVNDWAVMMALFFGLAVLTAVFILMGDGIRGRPLEG